MDGKPACQQVQDDLEQVVDKHRGTVTLGEMLAAMEIVKLNLWLEQRRLQEADEEGAEGPESWSPEP
jgi:hypothetical protein